MNKELWIPGPLPGMNEIIQARAVQGIRTGRGGRYWVKGTYAAMKKKWAETIAVAAKAAGVKQVNTPVIIHLWWVEKDMRRDVDNVQAGAKIVLDSLVEAGIIPNDNRKNVVHVNHHPIDVLKTEPGVMVEFEEPLINGKKDKINE